MRSATLHLLAVSVILLFASGGSLANLLVLPNAKSQVNKLEKANYGLIGRIVNGTEATLGQFPHQVSLMRSYSQKHFCGGSLISVSWVLTAGHCVYLYGSVVEPWTVTVAGGIVKLNGDTTTRQQSNVVDIRVHPDFDLVNLYNDVAVLKLTSPFTFTPQVRNVPLAGNPFVPYTVCQVAGWGYLSSSIPIVSPDLLYVDLPVRSIKECRELLVNVTDLPAGMICAGYLEGGRDACQGDSGGGMVCDGILTGIVSGGNGCAEPRLPGVYADVFHYLDWITTNTEAVRIIERRKGGNHGTSNTSSITAMTISFLFYTVINYI
ncbi:hypothetical protein PUN28_014916 [Cardiocondyla obscurior]|uniref:chymotrypsin n=2 Tax=Cardiocondyla obscurior TaxID=286306 RepID=A0AAW2EW50_9HYME